MAQILYNGSAAGELIDASTLTGADYRVFRSLGGNDTLIGSAGNDRFDGG
ncbi:MAG: hypothetical protein ACOYOH_12315, partial [Paracraurococcus sp.]